MIHLSEHTVGIKQLQLHFPSKRASKEKKESIAVKGICLVKGSQEFHQCQES